MSDATEIKTTATKRDRSPAYPFISLKTAIERVAAFDAKFGRHGSPLGMAGLAWGYKGDSSQSAQTLSALKYFGLVEYTGTTNDRKAGLTDDARNYLRAQLSTSKLEIARACALRPKTIRMYWEKWGADRPIDDICLDQMILKDGFTESAAKTFIKVYDETIDFSGLRGDHQIDKIQDGEEDTLTDIELIRPAPQADVTPSNRYVEIVPIHAPQSKGVGMRQEVFTVDEGDVTIQWPERMSQASIEDFMDWIKILERKIKRSVLTPQPEKTEGSPE